MVDHLRIHLTETGEPVHGAPTYIRCTRLHCPHCPRTFMQRMGLFGHMRIHECGIECTPDTPNKSSTPTLPWPAPTPSRCAHTAANTTKPGISSTPTTLSPTHTPSLNAPTTTSSSTTITVADTDTADFSCPYCPAHSPNAPAWLATGEPVPGAST
ncbi:hypothetical protein SprV_0301090900 [Sparganum proliferum]